MTLRPAVAADLPAMAALAEAKREQYQAWQPRFHRRAADDTAKHLGFLGHLLAQGQALVLVAEGDRGLRGFVVAQLVGAPPVYEPGGPVCLIDDFCVATPEDWATTGAQLLAAALEQAKARGAVLANVVCGPLDGPKARLLESQGLAVASEWRVKTL